ncbi:hypothetical protein ROA7450_01562 [Roseovarius albus]|uniref:Uncharacterized protein n=1 Tax=Roseovarius albus TaxID=1247867 RepID=A0A1X6YXW7_9RHOB|nr:DUF2059 domain-containing protein [Roseovarius albus]SLN34529.1 hypothetical protein ROA7450_01562 [Roseovarius albus]
MIFTALQPNSSWKSLSISGLATALVLHLTPAQAAEEEEIAQLIEVLKFHETAEIMREEGQKYGAEIAVEMLGGTNLASWQQQVSRIYDVDKMNTLVAAHFKAEVGDLNLAPAVAFFTSDLGAEITTLELAARRAFLDDEIEDEAIEQYLDRKDDEDVLIGQIATIIDDSDLIELNVMGGLNANFMFYRGLAEGGALDMSESDMLADVWAQEEGIRTDTEEWINAFLLMSYEPLGQDQLQSYIEFYRTETGQKLNHAMFAAFDQMYDEISYLLGQAVAQQLQSEQL